VASFVCDLISRTTCSLFFPPLSVCIWPVLASTYPQLAKPYFDDVTRRNVGLPDQPMLNAHLAPPAAPAFTSPIHQRTSATLQHNLKQKAVS